jgi:SAM-dependent methyltransferase
MEVLRFGHRGWWWKLRWAVWREFRDLDVGSIVAARSAAEFSYDETPTVTLARIFEIAELAPGARFVDLGAGRGVSTLAAALMGYSAAGLEIVPDYVTRAKKVATRLAIEVDFQEQDILQAEWPQGDLYLLNSTAFPDEMRTVLSYRLKQLDPEVLIVTYDWALDSEFFEEKLALRLPVTRGTVVCRFFYSL